MASIADTKGLRLSARHPLILPESPRLSRRIEGNHASRARARRDVSAWLSALSLMRVTAKARTISSAARGNIPQARKFSFSHFSESGRCALFRPLG